MAKISSATAAIVAAAGLFQLSACSLAPPHVRPDLPTPERFAEDYVADPAAGVSASALGWRDFF
ncbi:MAG: hypothetical protein ABW173_09210, partial [Sphingomonas sp.]